MRLTLATLKNSRLPKTLGLCSDDADFAAVINEAQQRLMERGAWWGTVVPYQVCVSNSGCLTWPRHIASILGCSINDSPIPMRNHWFEYLESGYGIRSNCNSSELQLFDQGEAVTFDDISYVSNTTLKIYSTETETAGLRMLIQGYDENNNWITSEDSGTIVDGEYLSITDNIVTMAETTKYFSTITGIQKPETAGAVYLLKSSPSQAADITIGYYERDETNPVYRRSMVPGMSNVPAYTCCDGDTISERRVVRVMAKLKHIDVSRDTDWLIIRSQEALKLAAQAIQLEDAHKHDRAMALWAMAENVLSKELEHYQGTANIEPVRVEPTVWGAGDIGNII